MKILSLSTLMLVLSASLSAQQSQSLRVMVDRIPDEQATTMVMLYGAGTQFLNDQAEALQIHTIPAGQNRASLELDGLVSGQYYAIMVFQDLNGNGVLDRRNGRPIEPYAFTEAASMTGTPSFSDVAFRLDEETSAILLNMVPISNRLREKGETLSVR